MNNKDTFKSIVKNTIHREGIDDLMKWLESSDFFEAPASTKYHGAYEGGLCEHSLDVYKNAQKIYGTYRENLEEEIPEESINLCALFHDLCKVNFYKKTTRNVKTDGHWEEVPCYTVQESMPFGGHGSKSLYIVQNFVKLEPQEAAAINSHMGAFPGGDAARDAATAYNAYPLAWIIHVADEAATYIVKR